MAGVVEYAPDPGGIGPNVNRFMSIIEGDEAKDVDILVFPEFALNNVSTPIEVPNAKDMIRPCGQQKYSDVMESLSCSANRARKYVVINVTTKLNCTDDATVSCPEWGYHMYNTAVVFNRNGIVVATWVTTVALNRNLCWTFLAFHSYQLSQVQFVRRQCHIADSCPRLHNIHHRFQRHIWHHHLLWHRDGDTGHRFGASGHSEFHYANHVVFRSECNTFTIYFRLQFNSILFFISIGYVSPGSVSFKYVLLSGSIWLSLLLFVMMCPLLVLYRFTSAAIMGARKQCQFIGGRYQCPRRWLLRLGHLFRTQWCIECHHQRYIDNQITGRVRTKNTRHHFTQNDFAQGHHAETSRSGQEFGHDIRTRESARFGISHVELHAEQTARRQNM